MRGAPGLEKGPFRTLPRLLRLSDLPLHQIRFEKTNFPCPNKDGGVLVKRKAKKRRSFFHGCSLYPKCNFLTNDTPVERPCPSCSFTYLLKGKGKTYCPVCNYEEKDGK